MEDLQREIEALQAQLAAKEAMLASQAAAVTPPPLMPYSKTFGRTSVAAVHASDGKGLSLIGKSLRIGGWVKTGRSANKDEFAFLELNDGTTPTNLQALVPASVWPIEELRHTGTCVLVEGELKASPADAPGQVVELHVKKVLHVGKCDAAAYPIGKKKITMEFLREKVHLRIRTNTIAALARIRNCLAFATHEFFQQNGFNYVHTPIITTADCEGAGEMFQVTTLLAEADSWAKGPKPLSAEDIQALKDQVSAAGSKVKEAKEAAKAAGEGADPAPAKAALAELNELKSVLSAAEERLRAVGGLPRKLDGTVDYSRDFFSVPSYLTVSGQLQGEMYACGMSNVYTFGPTFRAENSHTDDMACAEDYVKYCCKALLERCPEDLAFLCKMYDKDCVDRVKNVVAEPFARITYTEAVDILLKEVAGGRKFEYPVKWGEDLKSEHERFISEQVFKKPVIVYNYPKEIKAFYMRANEDGKTVAAMDVLVPKVGELIGGSQREERLDVLEARMREVGLPPEQYEWYLDLRRYGTVTHSGFGLGFERLILFTTGIENIRDVIPFPRWPGNCK